MSELVKRLRQQTGRKDQETHLYDVELMLNAADRIEELESRAEGTVITEDEATWPEDGQRILILYHPGNDRMDANLELTIWEAPYNSQCEYVGCIWWPADQFKAKEMPVPESDPFYEIGNRLADLLLEDDWNWLEPKLNGLRVEREELQRQVDAVHEVRKELTETPKYHKTVLHQVVKMLDKAIKESE